MSEQKKFELGMFPISAKERRYSLILNYMSIELVVWGIMSFMAVYHGKIFDYKYQKTEDFASHVNYRDESWYYRLMFGDLNLTNIDVEDQRKIQVQCDTLNTLFVLMFNSYFIFAVFFLFGMSKTLGSKCLLCPYVTYDISVLCSVVIFVLYGAWRNINILVRNGSFFLLVKLPMAAVILSFYRSLDE